MSESYTPIALRVSSGLTITRLLNSDIEVMCDSPREGDPGRLRIPDLPIEAARIGILQVDPCGAEPVVDIEQFGGVAGCVEGFRDHHDDAFPYVSHGIGREQAPIGRMERRTIARVDFSPDRAMLRCRPIRDRGQ